MSFSGNTITTSCFLSYHISLDYKLFCNRIAERTCYVYSKLAWNYGWPCKYRHTDPSMYLSVSFYLFRHASTFTQKEDTIQLCSALNKKTNIFYVS